MKKTVSLLISISGCNIKNTQEDDGQIKESDIDVGVGYSLTSDISKTKELIVFLTIQN